MIETYPPVLNLGDFVIVRRKLLVSVKYTAAIFVIMRSIFLQPDYSTPENESLYSFILVSK
jgi:hypothetical protein